jgi:hypothetical protein
MTSSKRIVGSSNRDSRGREKENQREEKEMWFERLGKGAKQNQRARADKAALRAHRASAMLEASL